MLVGGFEPAALEPDVLPLDTFDRVCLAVLGSFPLMAAARLAGELLSWIV